MNKFIPILLVLMILGGGAILAVLTINREDGYLGNRSATSATDPDHDTGDEPRRDPAEIAAEARGFAAQVIDRSLPIDDRRAAAIALARHPGADAHVPELLRGDSFVSAESDPDLLARDLNVLIALMLNLHDRVDATTLLALTDRLADERITPMVPDGRPPAGSPRTPRGGSGGFEASPDSQPMSEYARVTLERIVKGRHGTNAERWREAIRER